MTRTDNKPLFRNRIQAAQRWSRCGLGLARAGYCVLRLSARLVEQDPEAALRLIRVAL
jgi:very-short-patch-repair endonuclease